MKHSHRTRLTALMFSAAAVCTGMLTAGCGRGSYSVYGPPPVTELDDTVEITEIREPETTEPSETGAAVPDFAVPIDLDSLTDADFRTMSDEMLTALAKQNTFTLRPSFCGDLSAGFPDRCAVTKKAAETQEEAFALVCDEFYLKPESVFEEKDGFYWLYAAGSGVAYWYLVPDRAFFDPETQTLNAEVSEENMLLLAAMRDVPGERKLGAFVKDAGDHLVCNEYYLLYTARDDGLADTASLCGVKFRADKATGQVTNFVNEAGDCCFTDFQRTVEIPRS